MLTQNFIGHNTCCAYTLKISRDLNFAEGKLEIIFAIHNFKVVLKAIASVKFCAQQACNKIHNFMSPENCCQ